MAPIVEPAVIQSDAAGYPFVSFDKEQDGVLPAHCVDPSRAGAMTRLHEMNIRGVEGT